MPDHCPVTGVTIVRSQIRAYFSRLHSPGRGHTPLIVPNLNRGNILPISSEPGFAPDPALSRVQHPRAYLAPAVRFSTVGGVMQDVSFLGSID